VAPSGFCYLACSWDRSYRWYVPEAPADFSVSLLTRNNAKLMLRQGSRGFWMAFVWALLLNVPLVFLAVIFLLFSPGMLRVPAVGRGITVYFLSAMMIAGCFLFLSFASAAILAILEVRPNFKTWRIAACEALLYAFGAYIGLAGCVMCLRYCSGN